MSHNLPAELTSFVGRDPELVEIEGLVGQRRLVTLTGVGGCGKTRLAVQAGARLADRWADGVCLVDLGSVGDPAAVPLVVAGALGVPVEPDGDQVEALAAKVRGRELLLCLDTCEHVLDAAATVADTLLRRCPGMTLLATSREPLGVAGETVWQVPPLRPEEAHRLFGDRAGLVAPRFDADAVRDDVRAVCDQVDRIPLAIELAAAWVRALSPAQIAAGLAESFRLLAGGPRGAAPRHRTLDASVGWSHALLAADEKVMFRRLAVFSGAFTLDAARAVGGDLSAEGGPAGTLRLIGRLLDTSLVTARDGAGEIRYRLLDTVRQYAEERLVEAGEAEALRDAHLDHFLALAEAAEPGLDSDQDTWRRILDSHRANFDAALRWGLAPPAARADRGRRLAAALARQWLIRGQSAEGLGFLGRAVDLDPDDESAVQARLLAGTAMLGMISGRTGLVAEAAERGGRIAALVGPDADRAGARCLAMASFPPFFVDFERCQEAASRARAAGEAAGDPFARDWAAVIEGYALQTRNRHDEAVALARLAYARSRPRGDRFCAAFARGIEIFTTAFEGDVTGAVAIGREVVDIVTPLGDFFAVGTNTCNMAQAVALGGALDEARALIEPVVRSVESAPEVDVVGFMVPYGLVHLWEGDLDGAVEWFRRGVRRMSGTSRDWTAGRCLPGLVSALRRLGRTTEAADWAARAEALLTEFGAMYELANVLDEQAWLAGPSDPDRARDRHLRALVVRRDHGLRLGYADSLDALAGLAVAEDAAEAVRLLAAADAARTAMGYPRPPIDRPRYEALRASLGAALGAGRFAALHRDGAAADLSTTVSALTRGRGPRQRPSAGWDALTPAEVEVARLVTDGLSNPEIAARLYMSRSTVKSHLARVYAKVGVANRTELASLAGAGMLPG